MSEENKTVELKDEELEAVSGGMCSWGSGCTEKFSFVECSLTCPYYQEIVKDGVVVGGKCTKSFGEMSLM